jgi:hypothetical protein
MSKAKIEKIMSKTNDASRFATLEDHGALVDTELAAVTGGTDDLRGSNSGDRKGGRYLGQP